jgi:hypothetical protein
VIYYPRIENSGVMLIAGTHVRACYRKIKKLSPGKELVLLNAVAVLP